MAGIAIIADLLRKNSNFDSHQTIHSPGLFSASSTASTAAASVAATVPFASRFLFGYPKIPVAYCDAGASLADDYFSSIKRVPRDIFNYDSLKYSTKEYNFELKPLFSAFELRPLAMTTLRSFLMFYLPLLEPDMNTEENDDDFLEDTPEERRLDLVVPFTKSVKQIIRETTVVSTRRILERLAVQNVSERVAWKLLKDVPKSALRKAERGLPSMLYVFRVSRTTFRAHFLGVAASWLVQVGIEIYRCISRGVKAEEDISQPQTAEEGRVLVKKVSGITFRCGASLVFASVGAGIGAALFRPSTGQWIGCAVGDLTGPILLSICLEKVLHLEP